MFWRIRILHFEEKFSFCCCRGCLPLVGVLLANAITRPGTKFLFVLTSLVPVNDASVVDVYSHRLLGKPKLVADIKFRFGSCSESVHALNPKPLMLLFFNWRFCGSEVLSNLRKKFLRKPLNQTVLVIQWTWIKIFLSILSRSFYLLHLLSARQHVEENGFFSAEVSLSPFLFFWDSFFESCNLLL